MLYRDMPDGKCFRFAEPETICSREVYDAGVFVKIGNSHAVRVETGMEEKTVVPGLKVKCSPLPGKIDTSHLIDWSIKHQPYTQVRKQP